MKTKIKKFFSRRAKGGTFEEIARNHELAAEIIEGLSADLEFAVAALKYINACDSAQQSSQKAFKTLRVLECGVISKWGSKC